MRRRAQRHHDAPQRTRAPAPSAQRPPPYFAEPAPRRRRSAERPCRGSLEWLLRETSRDTRAQSAARRSPDWWQTDPADEKRLVRLQAAVRGWIVRRRFKTFLDTNTAATSIQAHWRGYRCRKRRRRRPGEAHAGATDESLGKMAPQDAAVLSQCRDRITRLERSEAGLRGALHEERELRMKLEVEHLKLEEAVRFLWAEVVALRDGDQATTLAPHVREGG